jgi:hypothetical protein
MKDTFKFKAITLAVLLCFIFSALVPASVAWLSGFVTVKKGNDFTASQIVSYFAKGDGSSADPFIIAEPEHLYNLSWLVNNGYSTEGKYFQVSDINNNSITLDMAGEISGNDAEQRSGAIPPIGTAENPFLGNFNGMGSVISDLWISTDSGDWKERPEKITDVYKNGQTNYVGLFGKISGSAIVNNFTLERVEVKTHVDATVGIVCGYVDAMVYNVGVCNGSITAANGAAVHSNYSLLGEKDNRIVWEDLPNIDTQFGGTGSGVIRVDVNDGIITHSETGLFITNNKLNSDYEDISKVVQDAMPNRSYFVGDVSITTQNKSPVFYIYSSRVNSSTGYTDNKKVVMTNNNKGNISNPTENAFLKITAGDENENSTYYTALHSSTSTIIKNNLTYNQDFDERINNLGGRRILLQTSDPPSFDMETTGWESNFEKIQFQFNGAMDELYVPRNGVWFKPAAAGPSIISFTITNSSNDAHRSIYRYKRFKDGENKGKIDPSSITETVFVLNVDKQQHNNKKNACFTNGDILAFEFMIDQTDVTAEYEFIIGNSSDYGNEDDRSGFLFLALAGASSKGPNIPENGESGFREAMHRVDYLSSTDVNMNDANYQIHQTILRIDQPTQAYTDAVFYYSATADPREVRYYSSPELITDISYKKQSKISDTLDENLFEPRETKK